MPPRAAPFEVGLVTLLSVSASLLVFSAAVLWTAGIEGSIGDIVGDGNPLFDAGGGPAASVPVPHWINGPAPTVGDPWVMIPPMTIFTPAAPATGFANSAGLVVG